MRHVGPDAALARVIPANHNPRWRSQCPTGVHTHSGQCNPSACTPDDGRAWADMARIVGTFPPAFPQRCSECSTPCLSIRTTTACSRHLGCDLLLCDVVNFVTLSRMTLQLCGTCARCCRCQCFAARFRGAEGRTHDASGSVRNVLRWHFRRKEIRSTGWMGFS